MANKVSPKPGAGTISPARRKEIYDQVDRMMQALDMVEKGTDPKSRIDRARTAGVRAGLERGIEIAKETAAQAEQRIAETTAKRQVGDLEQAPRRIINLDPFSGLSVQKQRYLSGDYLIGAIKPDDLKQRNFLISQCERAQKQVDDAEAEAQRLDRALLEIRQDRAKLGRIEDAKDPRVWSIEHANATTDIENMKIHHGKALDRLRNRQEVLQRSLTQLRDNQLLTYARTLAFQSDYAIRFYESLRWEAEYLIRFVNHITETELTEDEVLWRCMLLAKRFGCRNVSPDSFHGGLFKTIEQSRAYSTFDRGLIDKADPKQLDYLIGYSDEPPTAEDKKLIAAAISRFRLMMDSIRDLIKKQQAQKEEKTPESKVAVGFVET